MNPADLSMPEAGARLREGSLTAAALTEAHLARIAERDQTIHAFAAVFAEDALTQAAEADGALAGGADRGPLHGIPVGVKDLFDVAGHPTRCGSPVTAGDPPAETDAAAVARLRGAGAVVLGKLATYEFALVGPSFDGERPPVANPWDTAHITGGSSSGSAAAVAAGMLRASLGTDTGGSVRSPAAYCGVVGLKPSFGRVATAGLFPLAKSLDHVGPIAATVAEAALLLDAVADPSPHAAAASRIGEDVRGLRLAYARDWAAGCPDAEDAVLAALDDAASALSLLGVRVDEVRLPPYAVFEAAGAAILHAEALAPHAEKLAAQGGDYGRLAFQTLASGLCLTEQDLAVAQRAAAALRSTLDGEIFRRFDALLAPGTLAPAPPFAAFDGRRAVWTPMRTIPFNVTGHPALALPAGFSGGLPLGLQLVGPAFGEAGLCRLGHAFEQATDHGARRPVFPAARPAGAD